MSILRLIPMGASLRVAKGINVSNKLHLSSSEVRTLARRTIIDGSKATVVLTEKIARLFPHAYEKMVSIGVKESIKLPEHLVEPIGLKEVFISPQFDTVSNMSIFNERIPYECSAVNSWLKASLSPGQIVDLFTSIKNEATVHYAKNAFLSVPAAFDAKLNPDQIVDLFGKVLNASPCHGTLAFSTLRLALERKWAPDKIVSHFRWVTDKSLWQTEETKSSMDGCMTLYQVYDDRSPEEILALKEEKAN